MAKTEERDHVDRWLEQAWLEDIPNLDLEVEGIVDRMNGLTRRFKRSLNEAVAEHGLTFEDWDVLGALQPGRAALQAFGRRARRRSQSSRAAR